MMKKIHILAHDHKLSAHNPDGSMTTKLRHNGLAYRTALCGQVYYTKADAETAGRWVTQFGTLRAVSAGTDGSDCMACARVRMGKGHHK